MLQLSKLTDAFAWLATNLTEYASAEITYTRGASSVTIDAVPGRPQVDRAQVGGKSRVRLDDEWVVFHIMPELIDFGAGAVEPVRGDRVTIGSVVREVMPMDNEPCWYRSESSNSMYGVRTKRVT